MYITMQLLRTTIVIFTIIRNHQPEIRRTDNVASVVQKSSQLAANLMQPMVGSTLGVSLILNATSSAGPTPTNYGASVSSAAVGIEESSPVAIELAPQFIFFHAVRLVRCFVYISIITVLSFY